jgi:hypothetical protein
MYKYIYIQYILYIEQFSNLDYNMFLGRRHPTEQHEILDSGCDHRRALPQSRQIFHGQKMYFHDLISQNPGCIEIQV